MAALPDGPERAGMMTMLEVYAFATPNSVKVPIV